MTLGATTADQPGANPPRPEVEVVRLKQALAYVRGEFHDQVRRHAEIRRRVAALDEPAICSVNALTKTLEDLAGRWFPPDVSRDIDDQLERLSTPLADEAAALQAEIDRGSGALEVLRERSRDLKLRVDDAISRGRALFVDLASALDKVETKIGGLERTADALSASGLDRTVIGLGCVSYCRKVWQAGRGDGYLTLAGSNVVFQPIQKSGGLFRKSDQIGPPEVLDVSPGLTISELRRPKLGDHGITLRQIPPGTLTIYLSLSSDALDDLIAARS